MEVVLGLFLPKHELYDRERHIKFSEHLGGFGADMFEAEINKSNTVFTFILQILATPLQPQLVKVDTKKFN